MVRAVLLLIVSLQAIIVYRLRHLAEHVLLVVVVGEEVDIAIVLADNIVVVDELLLLRDHVLEVYHRPRLQLKIQEKLHVLTLQEVVLDDELEEVSDVLVLDTLLDRVLDAPDVLIVFVQVIFHSLSFDEVLLRRLVQDQYLLLLLFSGFAHLLDFPLQLLYASILSFSFAILSHLFDGVLNVLYLLGCQKYFGFPLSDLHRVERVLLVQLNEGLF